MIHCNIFLQEVELQGVMLDNLDAKVDDVNDQLENINMRLRKALENVWSCQHGMLHFSNSYYHRCERETNLLLILFY